MIKPHTAHKTSGTHLHEATLSIKKIQKWLGHSTAAVTAEICVRDRAGTDAAAARQVADYLAQCYGSDIRAATRSLTWQNTNPHADR